MRLRVDLDLRMLLKRSSRIQEGPTAPHCHWAKNDGSMCFDYCCGLFEEAVQHVASEIIDQRDLLVSLSEVYCQRCLLKETLRWRCVENSRYVLQKLSGQNIMANAPGAVLKERKKTDNPKGRIAPWITVGGGLPGRFFQLFLSCAAHSLTHYTLSLEREYTTHTNTTPQHAASQACLLAATRWRRSQGSVCVLLLPAGEAR